MLNVRKAFNFNHLRDTDGIACCMNVRQDVSSLLILPVPDQESQWGGYLV